MFVLFGSLNGPAVSVIVNHSYYYMHIMFLNFHVSLIMHAVSMYIVLEACVHMESLPQAWISWPQSCIED